ncbi:MAG: FxsA family protein [Pseudoprimorskyibacter sp.]|nr:FxsA family protein [Pseudoprimorskyibacter sp.]
MWVFLVFLAIPLIEIALFLQAGAIIGTWWTLAIVVATALLGSFLVRSQGTAAISNLRQSFGDFNNPVNALAHGALIIFSGALLLTPGFFTDTVGFLLLCPPIRESVIKYFSSRVAVARFGTDSPTDHHNVTNDVIDGEFTHVDNGQRQNKAKSGWTKR